MSFWSDFIPLLNSTSPCAWLKGKAEIWGSILCTFQRTLALEAALMRENKCWEKHCRWTSIYQNSMDIQIFKEGGFGTSAFEGVSVSQRGSSTTGNPLCKWGIFTRTSTKRSTLSFVFKVTTGEFMTCLGESQDRIQSESLRTYLKMLQWLTLQWYHKTSQEVPMVTMGCPSFVCGGHIDPKKAWKTWVDESVNTWA